MIPLVLCRALTLATRAGEIFPLPIRSRGVGLSTASNWLWNTIITVITPYMVNPDAGNLRSSVFFIWVRRVCCMRVCVGVSY